MSNNQEKKKAALQHNIAYSRKKSANDHFDALMKRINATPQSIEKIKAKKLESVFYEGKFHKTRIKEM